ncbi:hypothetical protein [Xenorhabdus griffiniae]|uniref:Transposase n=1 Tax=Xenorhabdus griffiniae TaxID=351672 RepID=A0ABY9XGN6_9GAMM|nr:hypothetical protein [Xenorhabdus griffiniae]MBD1229055.1 hypothetical protein [Xenorhabdus griffiniae]MBE8588803.1 hypothetical protein [Xenorhabdus griffiniae]WMV72043.1 hypothetical protein QL128_18320 [Xenorhabdus griffiniae]WNH01721.1 hypothetical protein QL112_018330 [Xenorhabdus griffiniae]
MTKCGSGTHIMLSLLAHAVLSVLRIQEKKTPEELISLSVTKLRKLLPKLMVKTKETVEQILYWSSWRRRHQYRVQQYHYRQRKNLMITERLRM